MASPQPSTRCPLGADNQFGPRVDPDCRYFDFTLAFEDVFLIVPAAVFLALLPVRLIALFKAPVKSSSFRLVIVKLILIVALIALHIAYLVLAVQTRTQTEPLKTSFTLPGEILTLIAILGATALSFLEDQRSVRPSDLLVLYFSFSTILSIPRVRTLWTSTFSGGDMAGPRALWTSIFALTALSALAESIRKTRFLRLEGDRHYSSEQISSFWGRSFFVWVVPFFNIGYGTRLTMADIPRTDSKLEEAEAWASLEAAWRATRAGSSYRLLRASFRAYWPSFLAVFPPRLAQSAFTFCQPFLFAAAVSNLEAVTKNQEELRTVSTYEHALIGAFVLVYTGMAVCRALYQRQIYRLQSQLRAGLISKIFRDMTTMRKADIQDSTAVTLMGTNVDTIVSQSRDVHQVWSSLLEIGVATWLLARELGVAAVLPTVICLISVICASRIASLFGPAQMAWIMRVQTRVSVTAEMIGEIKTIKMLGLTSVVSSIITKLRIEELKASETFRKLLISQILVGNIPTLLAPFATFLVYAIIAKARNDESILAAKAFSSLSWIALIANPLLALCEALPSCNQVVVCFRNVEIFLIKAPAEDDEAEGPNITAEKSRLNPQPVDTTSVGDERPRDLTGTVLYSLKDACVRWSSDKSSSTSEDIEDSMTRYTLQDITVDIHPGLTGITGPVGSGKSTLLSSLIGETVLVSGSVEAGGTANRRGTVAYCSQVAWATDDTIRNNIIGGHVFDEKWYDFTIESCSLGADIARMDRGDQTMCGSKGSSLSGGQRQRVALARAVYSRAPIVILDDITSGLDSESSTAIMNRLFSESGYFKSAGISVILATHQAPLLSCMDYVILLEHGQITGKGSYTSLRPTVAASLKEDKENLDQTDEENIRNEPSGATVQDILEAIIPAESRADLEEDETAADANTRRTGSWEVYSYYASTAGVMSIIWWTIYTVIGAVFGSVTPIWINKWTVANAKRPNQNLGFYLGVYAMFIIISTLGTAGECWTFFVNIISDTALGMHNHLLEATLGAPIHFFQMTDTGSITNRFSQDMDLIDMTLPIHAITFTTALATCLVQIIVICVVGKYLTATVPVLALTLFLVQRYYLRTSRQLRLIDIEAKAPIFKLFLETIQGMPAVRLLGWGPFFHRRNADALNMSQRAFYMLHSIQQWLALVLDLIVGAIAVLIIGTATAAAHTSRTPLSGGDVGVALVTVLNFGQVLGQCFQSWTRLETSIGAVSRVKQHVRDTPREESPAAKDGGVGNAVPDNWPSDGSISFRNVQASYTATQDPVLKNITFDISPGEKVVLCGSSGSGKSSLVMSMLQMMNVTEGSVYLDDVDVSKMDKSFLRQQINIVPQEAFFLPGTLRSNLDPFSKGWPEDALKEAVEKVGLWNKVEEAGGLDATFQASDWSQGEKQLLCLARALLKPSRILILDEAMSSVDKETEALMQNIIDRDFRHCTVVSVLHRFAHVYRYGRILVMQQGKLVESGTPEELNGPENFPGLQASSAFSRLYHASL